MDSWWQLAEGVEYHGESLATYRARASGRPLHYDPPPDRWAFFSRATQGVALDMNRPEHPARHNCCESPIEGALW